eukprot:jgi/Picsp_1/4424/NSC_06646-R1_hypothetical protein GMO_06380 [Gluconobacter morbifer G707]
MIEIHFFTFHWNQPEFLEAWARHHSAILGSFAKSQSGVVGTGSYRNLHVIDHNSTNLYAIDLLARLQRLGAGVRRFSGPFTEKGKELSGWMREFREGQSSEKSRSTFLIPLDVDEFLLPRRHFCSEMQSISSPNVYQRAWKSLVIPVKSHQSAGDNRERLQTYQVSGNGPGVFVKTASTARIKMNSYIPKMWQWYPPSTSNRDGKGYLDLIRPKYQNFGSSSKMSALRNPKVDKYHDVDDDCRNVSRKTLFSSKFFLSTDQGNHYGFVTSDRTNIMVRNPETRNRNSPTSLHSAILHISFLSWHRFQSKILRAKEQYDFRFRLTHNGHCTGNGRHMCLEYRYFLHNGLISWKKKYLEDKIAKYW